MGFPQTSHAPALPQLISAQASKGSDLIHFTGRTINIGTINYTGRIQSSVNDGPALTDVAGSTSVPTFLTRKSDATTGLGGSVGTVGIISAGIRTATFESTHINFGRGVSFKYDSYGVDANTPKVKYSGVGSSTNPVFLIDKDTSNTGVGGDSSRVSLIAGGNTILEAIDVHIKVGRDMRGILGDTPKINFESVGTSTVPSFVTSWGDPDTGFGGTGTRISSIVGGVEIIGSTASETTISNNLTVSGNFTVNGSTTTVDTETLSVEDPLIKLGNSNILDTVDLGFYGVYNDGTEKYSGVFRDASDGVIKFFTGLQVEPTTTVDTAGTGYTKATIDANISGLVIGTDVQAYSDRLGEISALNPADGEIIVGGGSGWVSESGATARASLGLTIGTDVQAYHARLDDVAGLTPSDGNFIVGDGTNFIVESGATARASLGLVIGTDVQAYNSKLNTIGSLGVTNNNIMVANGTTWTLKSPSSARTSLGVAIGTNVQAFNSKLTSLGALAFDDTKFMQSTASGYQWATLEASDLSDYEEGNFTPAFLNIGTGTYDTQLGSYTKKGDEVTCHIEMKMASLGTASGNVYITNLPFTPASFNFATGGVYGNSFASTAENLVGSANGATQILMNYDMGGTGKVLTHAILGAVGRLFFTFTYKV